MPERPDIRLTPEEQAAFLRKNRKCGLATIDQDGFPHLVAMNFAVRDSAYAELKGVMVRGHCEIAEGPEAVSEVFAWMAEDRREPRPAGASRSAPKRVVLKIVPT